MRADSGVGLAGRLTYRGIADDIAARIIRGERGYRPGDKLPSVNELCGLYGVGRSTAAHALVLLHERGLIEGQQGVGTFVRPST